MKLRKIPLLENISHLFVLQFLNYFIPFITFPYLARLFGPERFGILVFAQSVILYAGTVMDLGTSQNAVREIAKIKTDRQAISDFFSRMFGFKISLFILIFLLLIPVILLFFKGQVAVFFATSISLLGSALFPVWLFQGMEEMKFITIVNLISKSVTTISIFIFVKDQSDLVFAAFLQNCSLFLAGIISFAIIYFHFRLNLIPLFQWNSFKAFWKGSNKIFSSQALGNIYTQGATILVGFLAGSVAVGDYSFASKIIAAFAGLSQPIAQGLYPYLTNIYLENTFKFFVIRKKIIALFFITGICLSILILISGEKIIFLIGGGKFNHSQMILSILGLSLTFIILNVILNSFILAMGHDSQMLRMYFSVVLLFLILSIPMTLFIGPEGMAVSILVAEILIFYFSHRMTRMVPHD